MKDKTSFNWRDLALAASLGISGVLLVKTFLGSNHNNNGNGHAPPPRIRNGGRHPPMLPPQYDYNPGMMPAGAIPYGGMAAAAGPPPPPQQRRLPPGYRQAPPPEQMQQQPYYGEPTPGSQNTIGRAVLSQGDYPSNPGMMVHDRRSVRMAGNE